MQPARAPRAKEHTNNPVQKPNFRGHATGDGEVTRACGRLPPQAREPLQTIIPAGQKPYREDSGREDPGGGVATMQRAVDLAALGKSPSPPCSEAAVIASVAARRTSLLEPSPRRVAARSVAAALRDLRRRAAPSLEPSPFVARRVAARSVAAAFRDLRRRAAPALEPSPFVVLRCLRRRSSYVAARSFAAPRRRSVRRRRAPRQPPSPPSPLVVRRCSIRRRAVSPPRSETSESAIAAFR